MQPRFYRSETHGGVRFWRILPFEEFGCRALFFMRPGGFSRGIFRGLNLGLHTGDDPGPVLKNRDLALATGAFGPRLPVLGHQVHGKAVAWVGRRDAGRGWVSLESSIPGTDALLTSDSGLPLGILTADCLPILLASETGKMVAAIHAGWRGIANGIIQQTLQQLRGKLKTSSSALWAAIGPAIGPSAFIVHAKVAETLRKVCPSAMAVLPENQQGFDLWQAAKQQLLEQGLLPKKIIIIPECTASHPRKYYSYRRDKETGRMLGIIQIKQVRRRLGRDIDCD